MSSLAGSAALAAAGGLLGAKQLVKITGADLFTEVELDAAVSESHGIKARATRHPVEQGSDVTDNVRIEPIELSITGVVTNTVAAMFGFLEGGTRAEDAFDKLREMIESRKPVTIRTTLRKYEDMVIEELSIPRDAARGNMIEVTIRAVQITTVSSETVAAGADPSEQRGKGTKAAGKKPGVPVESPKGSALSKLF